ncbi:MAG: HAMP domain-containing histidine kinase [Pirellulales bacterium]|nr:HAMP domain-containing histidine kinase [Pirellulales bacterium]
MLARLPIRSKLILALLLWLFTVSVLCWSSFEGLYAFRGLVKHLERVASLPRATDLERRVNQLHLELSERAEGGRTSQGTSIVQLSSEELLFRMELKHDLEGVRSSLEDYRAQSKSKLAEQDQRDFDAELASLQEIELIINELDTSLEKGSHQDGKVTALAIAKQLKAKVGDLPRAVQSDVSELPAVARVAYGQRIRAAWVTSLFAAGLTAFMLWILYRWVFRPLRVLIKGSRKVVRADFNDAIRLDSQDEMGELADAMNEMTHEFRTIRDDLDRQVQERTSQAVRTERLAGVGFLAAGVADEISTPLAVIRDRAKTLEAVFSDGSHAENNASGIEGSALPKPSSTDADSHTKQEQRIDPSTAIKELQAISAAAFRCKEITESLLDLSRSGNNRRERLDIGELGQSVVDLLVRSGKYANKTIELKSQEPIVVEANPQEIKQVVLSLLVHRLDRVGAGQVVTLHLNVIGEFAQLVVSDSDDSPLIVTRDVSIDLEEPAAVFGLSLAECIVRDYGGNISTPTTSIPSESDRQERVRVILPLAAPFEESSHQYQVA